MTEEAIAAAARLLAEARRSHAPIAPLPSSLRPRDEADGYRVQAALHAQLEAGGAPAPAGHKIGCTTAVMQEHLGIANPCAGRVAAAAVHVGEGAFAARGAMPLGVECEVAVRLGADLPPRPGGAPYVRSEVAAAVAACMAAIEVVEDRYLDHRSLGAPTLIADDFFSAGAVLGPPLARDALDPEGLDAVAARMLVDGEEVGRGRGAAVLGHPLAALAWLASSASARGLTLRAGEVVLLGSVVRTHWIAPGAAAVVQVVADGLGEARARVA